MDFGATAEETLGRGTVGLGDEGILGWWDLGTKGFWDDVPLGR